MTATEEFKDKTGYDIEGFLNRFVGFISSKSQYIIDYYSGLVPNMDRDAYNEFLILKKDSRYVLDLFYLNKDRFNTIDFWSLVEFCDDISIKLDTIANFSKYARSSVSKESFSSDITFQFPLREGETIEEMMTRMGSSDRDNDWADIVISNSIIQEDYNMLGGKVIRVTFKNNSNFSVNSIVGSAEGDKIKGMDICRELSFEDNDLKVLGYDDTVQQNIDILLGLKRNSSPEFFDIGIDPTTVTGVTMKSMMIPSLLRQLFEVMATDDVISRVEVTGSSFTENGIDMSLGIYLKTGDNNIKTLNIGN